MQFSTIASALAALSVASTTLAAPSPVVAAVADTATIEDRAAKGSEKPLIDLWFNAKFLDIKFTGSADLGECKNFQSKFNDVFTSAKAKPGFRCTVWVNTDCKGDGFSFDEDGSKQFPSWIDNKSSSWKCVKN